MTTSIEDIVRRIVREEIAAWSTVVSATPLPAADPRQHYSVASVARLLEVSTDYIYNRIKDGSLSKVVELGAGQPKQRIACAELDRFLATRTFPRDRGTTD